MVVLEPDAERRVQPPQLCRIGATKAVIFLPCSAIWAFRADTRLDWLEGPPWPPTGASGVRNFSDPVVKCW